ncbi:MAG: tRNA pseudouridine(13) synthase TruD [Desulfurococcales archaeon ex4484_58]|nr:MAG: tRNA pseudouridine(13) synthase TruD [Desulfurococcales archaeon ex4484_58]
MKNAYLHPLDYVIGAKYYLVEDKVDVEYRVNSDSFYVEEIIDFNKLGFNYSDGAYIVLEIIKRDIDTFSVVDILSRELGLPRGNIVYMGLKDKYSHSKQYLFVKKELYRESKWDVEGEYKNFIVKKLGFVRRKPHSRDHLGNLFKVSIQECSEEDYFKAKRILEAIQRYGLPSYFGYQRFGVKRFNNHLLGKYIVINRYDLFIKELLHNIYPNESIESINERLYGSFSSQRIYEKILVNSSDPWRGIRIIRSMVGDLFLDAYASYLYNLLLNRVIEENGWNSLDSNYPTIGCLDSIKYYREILDIEGLSHNKLLDLKCWYRRGLFRFRSFDLRREGRGFELSFTLDRGFYASIVLRELFKNNLVL